VKVGIYCPWANGDMIMSTPVLIYRDHLWPNAKLVWFILTKDNKHAAGLHRAHPDLVAHNPHIDEVRVSMSKPRDLVEARVGHHTNSQGHPLSVGDKAGKMRQGYRRLFPELADIDLCYFPGPQHNCDKLTTTSFALICRSVFPFPGGAEIHPCLYFTKVEEQTAKKFVDGLPHPYTIMLETEYHSGQSYWNADLTRETMKSARQILGKCNFVFASPKGHLPFKDDAGVVDCSAFTIRQCIPVFNHCDLFIGVASGISHAVSSWSASDKVRRVDCSNNPFIDVSCTARGPCSSAQRKEQAIPAIVEQLKAIKR